MTVNKFYSLKNIFLTIHFFKENASMIMTDTTSNQPSDKEKDHEPDKIPEELMQEDQNHGGTPLRKVQPRIKSLPWQLVHFVMEKSKEQGLIRIIIYNGCLPKSFELLYMVCCSFKKIPNN